MAKLAKFLQGVAGAAGGASLNVEEVFSTYLYTGNGTGQTITNGIDLASDGGLVWAKSRSGTRNHILSDTERGTGQVLFSNLTNANDLDSTTITSYNSDGFTMGSSTFKMNTSGEDFASWTFRKAPKFFDVVTYTGDGTSSRNISHNLGTTVGFIIIKSSSYITNWSCYHRELSDPRTYIELNKTDAQSSDTSFFPTAPTDTQFTVGSDGSINGSGRTYVAYLFAHNEDLIQCGSFSGNDATVNVDLGWQPQFIIAKGSNAASNWHMYDNERGAGAYLLADSSGQEFTDSSPDIVFNSTGFDASGNFGISGRDYIYMAIKAED